MSLAGGSGLTSLSHLNGGGCITLPCSSDTTMISAPADIGPNLSPSNLRVEKQISEPSVGEKCPTNGIMVHVDNLLPSPSVVLHPPESVQMQWDCRYIYIPEPVGLLNAGNTCFLNSVLQCLTFTAPLANYFLNNSHKRDPYCGEFCIMCRMQNHIKMCFTINSRFYKPNGILERLQMIARHMERGRQEDAHEFLRCLTEAMQKRLLMPHKNLDPFSRETTLLNQIFGGYLRSQVVCCNCGAVSNTYEPFLDISLDVKDVNSVEEALKNFIRVETLDNDNKYGCDSCHQKVKAYKRFTVHQAPRVMTFQLKRYSANSNIKLNNRTTFPLSLDLYRYLSDTLDGKPTHVYYELYGVLVHCGLTTTSGHYYCCAKSSNKNWYKLNDGVVTQIQITDVLREEAYLLFYMQSGMKTSVTNAPSKIANGLSNQSPSSNAVFCRLSSCADVRTDRNGNCAAGNIIIGPQLPAAGSTTGKLIHNGSDAMGSVMIGPQLPKRKVNGVEAKRVGINGDLQLTQNSGAAGKSVSAGGYSVGTTANNSCMTRPVLTGLSVTVCDNLSSDSTSFSSSAYQSGSAPIKAVDERCKISFNIKSNGLQKNKTERTTLPTGISSNKLVPYDDGVSDDEECEEGGSSLSSHRSAAVSDQKRDCNIENDTGLNAVHDELSVKDALVCEALPPESMENGSLVVTDTKEASLALNAEDSDAVDQREMSVVKTSEEDVRAAIIPCVTSDNSSDDKKPQVTANCLRSTEHQSLNGTEEHISSIASSSKRKRRGHHKKVKVEKRHRRRSASVSSRESSDEAELEYIWVEKPAVFNGNMLLVSDCSRPPNSSTDPSVNGKASVGVECLNNRAVHHLVDHSVEKYIHRDLDGSHNQRDDDSSSFHHSHPDIHRERHASQNRSRKYRQSSYGGSSRSPSRGRKCRSRSHGRRHKHRSRSRGHRHIRGDRAWSYYDRQSRSPNPRYMEEQRESSCRNHRSWSRSERHCRGDDGRSRSPDRRRSRDYKHSLKTFRRSRSRNWRSPGCCEAYNESKRRKRSDDSGVQNGNGTKCDKMSQNHSYRDAHNDVYFEGRRRYSSHDGRDESFNKQRQQ